MVTKTLLYAGIAVVGLAVLLAAWPATRPSAQQAPPAAVQIDNDDIGGVVTSKNGPEAGVWVIAETTELGTRFAKIAVTDDHGRYVIPDLPQATYNVWVRGYGLVDSPKVKSARGQIVNLTAVLAPRAAAAADSGQEPVPGHRPRRQRHASGLQEPGTVAQRRPVERLRQLSPARRQGNA